MSVRAEIVGVGTELLLGQIANTNARWISERLATVGVDVLHHQAVGDNIPRIIDVLRVALGRADVVLVTGGLGPTEDDLTRDAIAELLGAPMVRHPEIEDLLREKFAGYGRGDMPLSNLRQADVPQGVRTITPDRGTAPGLVADLPDGKRIYAVPGVPIEMEEMMDGTILPELAALAGPATIVSRTLRSASLGESRVAERLRDLFEASSNPSVAYLASSSEVKVRLTAKARTEQEAQALLAPLVADVRARLGDALFTVDDEELEQAVGRLLRAAGKTLACAESLTGGGVAARLTSVPGASAYLIGSAVVYTADAKRDVLGVSQETIDGPGVVSEACALEMAAGARRLFGADMGVSLTGAAGPEPHGGADAGTVWIAVDADDVRHARGFHVPGERFRVRGGPSRRPSICCVGTWKTSRSPAATSTARIHVVDDPVVRTDDPAIRLFLAVDVPQPVVLAVATAIEPWRERFPKIRWVPPANWHITLKFLGATRPDRVSWVEETVGGIVSSHRRVNGGRAWARSVPVGGAGARALGRGGRPGRRTRRARDGSRGGTRSGVPQGDATIPSPSHRRAVGASGPSPRRLGTPRS